MVRIPQRCGDRHTGHLHALARGFGCEGRATYHGLCRVSGKELWWGGAQACRAVTPGSQLRHDPRAQDRRLPGQDGEQDRWKAYLFPRRASSAISSSRPPIGASLIERREAEHGLGVDGGVRSAVCEAHRCVRLIGSGRRWSAACVGIRGPGERTALYRRCWVSAGRGSGVTSPPGEAHGDTGGISEAPARCCHRCLRGDGRDEEGARPRRSYLRARSITVAHSRRK